MNIRAWNSWHHSAAVPLTTMRCQRGWWTLGWRVMSPKLPTKLLPVPHSVRTPFVIPLDLVPTESRASCGRNRRFSIFPNSLLNAGPAPDSELLHYRMNAKTAVCPLGHLVSTAASLLLYLCSEGRFDMRSWQTNHSYNCSDAPGTWHVSLHFVSEEVLIHMTTRERRYVPSWWLQTEPCFLEMHGPVMLSRLDLNVSLLHLPHSPVSQSCTGW